MKPLIKVADEHKYLFDVVAGRAKIELLFSAIRLDLFTDLEEPKTAEEVALIKKYNVKNTEYVLNALTGIELIEKKAGKYKNNEISNLYLSRNSSGFAGDLIISFNQLVGFEQTDIVKAVKEGPKSLYDKDGLEGHRIYGDYSSILKKSQRIGRAREFCDLIKQIPEFKSFKKMLDLGGGPGLISIALAQEKEDLRGVIFDTPETISVAKECLAEYNMENRITTMTGDYINDDIGNSYDFILASGTLNFAKSNLDNVTKKIYDSLNDEGVFMCVSEGLFNEKTKPARMVLEWLPSCLKGLDFQLEQGAVSGAAMKNGFKIASKKTINAINGILDIDILKK